MFFNKNGKNYSFQPFFAFFLTETNENAQNTAHHRDTSGLIAQK